MIPGQCPCGSGHRRIADIEGRLDDSFRWGPVEAHPHVIRTSLARERNVVEYQVRQRPPESKSICAVRVPWTSTSSPPTSPTI